MLALGVAAAPPLIATPVAAQPAQKSQEQANTDSTTEGKRDIRGFKLGMTNWR